MTFRSRAVLGYPPDGLLHANLYPNTKLPRLRVGELLRTQNTLTARGNKVGNLPLSGPGAALINEECDDRKFLTGSDNLQSEIRDPVPESKMADVQFVFPGYNMAARVYKPDNEPKRKYFSSPYRYINNSNGNITTTSKQENSIHNRQLDRKNNLDMESTQDNQCTIVIDKQGIQYQSMPGKLLSLPPIEDLSLLRRPPIQVKVSVEKKHGKFEPVPVIEDSDQGFGEQKYRLTKFQDNNAEGSVQCHRLMGPKALKHPAKMRAVHIPYHRTNENADGKSQVKSNDGSEKSRSLRRRNSNRKSVRFASETIGTPRESFVKTPTPITGAQPDDQENINFSNNNKVEFDLPDIQVVSKPSEKQAKSILKSGLSKQVEFRTNSAISPKQLYPEPIPPSPCVEGVTRRKGSITQITFLSHGEFRSPQPSPCLPRSGGQGQPRVKATSISLPASLNDKLYSDDFLERKYPHILNAMKTNPMLLDTGKIAVKHINSKAKQRMIQNFFNKPEQTNATPVSPDGIFTFEDD